MKKLLLIIAILLALPGCTKGVIPIVYAQEPEPTPVTVVNPVTIEAPVPPLAPGDICISGITDVETTVSWTPVSTATQYSVWVNDIRWTGANAPGITIQGLEPYTIYDIYVTAINESGESEPSPIASFITLPPVPAAPAPPTVTNVTDNSAIVQWEPLPSFQCIAAYRVYVDGIAVADVDVAEGTQEAELTNLTGGKHTVSIAGINENCEGPASQPKEFRIRTITAPAGLVMTNHSTDKIWLKWDDMPEADKYIINVDGQPAGETKQVCYLVSGLQPDHTYSIGVVAVMPDGNRSQEAIIQLETSAPTAPTKDSLLKAIFAYVPDMVPGLIAVFVTGATFAVARAAKEPFTRRLWRG